IVGALVMDNANYPMPNGNSSYTLVGNAFCRPNLPPVAAMTAAPTEGCTPLLVNFDGSGSYDPDSGDTIATYTFDFGDGSPILMQATPTTSHSYTTSGFFQAKLKVTETRQSLTSTNTALANIETVDDEAPVVSAPPDVTVTQTICQ
ncbi:MAG TPA: PKD domain-containing protein, partial [Thermoanaerobaculia bacterium]|nr:PKD domain-containing protein [Thermoanaerobaculia bacterium]